MHHPDFRQVLAGKFGADADQIVDFLERDFSENGELVVASIFLYAKEVGKELAKILEACEAEWQRNWVYQHSDIKGDPDAPGNAGVQNRASLASVYAKLGILDPLEEGKKIPPGAFVVKTRNSTYRLGEVDQSGGRAISKDDDELDFSRCIVVFLAKGKRMMCRPLDCRDQTTEEFSTSSVQSIVVE